MVITLTLSLQISFISVAIFEVVAVKSLNENYEFLEMNNFDEYLEFHFAHDNFLLIHYGLVAKDCTIIKSLLEGIRQCWGAT